jgi:hypothetical protein
VWSTSNIKILEWQTTARGAFDPQRLSGAVANQPFRESARALVQIRVVRPVNRRDRRSRLALWDEGLAMSAKTAAALTRKGFSTHWQTRQDIRV